MPPTCQKSSPALRIELDDPRGTYFPGEILNGFVICETPPAKMLPSHAVQLKMFGRAKTKYTRKSSNGTSIKRGRAVFFEEKQMLHRGSICQNRQHTWAFSIRIPEASRPGFGARGDSFKPDHGYLSTLDSAGKMETDVSKHHLPSVMYYFSESFMSGKTVEAYIEYVLVAEGGDAIASLPLYVRRRYSPLPITDHRMKTKSFYHMFKTPRLLPEHAGKPLTIGQKMSGVFRPSKTPQYTLTVKVEYPTLIQLENPNSIPLRICIAPIMDPEKTTICSEGNIDNLPPVEIVSMEIGLRSDVNIRCPGMLWDSGTTKEHTFNFQFRRPMKSAMVPIVQEVPDFGSIASAPENASASCENTEFSSTSLAPMPTGSKISPDSVVVDNRPKSLDLGAYNSILLGCSASSTLNLPPVSFKRQVQPTFQTYNINVTYSLDWKIELVCAGETRLVESSAPVRIVAPSEEQEVKKQRALDAKGIANNFNEFVNGVGQVTQFVGGILLDVLL